MTRTVKAAFETMQFFELDIPDGMTPEEYMETDQFTKDCAELVACGFIDFQLERKYDKEGNEI